MDLQRLGANTNLQELGLDCALGTGICLVEWPDRLGDYTPPDRLDICIRIADPRSDLRTAQVTAHGAEWQTRIEELADSIEKLLCFLIRRNLHRNHS